MNSRERVLTAIDRKETDRVPLDLGGYQSGICWKAYDRLKKRLGIEGETKICERTQMLAEVDEKILQKIKIDTRYVFPSPGREAIWKDNDTFIDEWGVIKHMPSGGNYYDMVYNPLSEMQDPSELEKYNWPELNLEKRCAGLKEKARYLHEETDYAVFTSLNGVLEHAWYLRGMERFFMDIIENRKFVEALLDKLLEIHLSIDGYLLDEIGEYLDCIEFWGDLGSQDGPLYRPSFYREVFKPRQKALIDFVKSKTDAKIAWHSCGSDLEFITDFIEIGIDLLNPVQTNAKGMDPEFLKKEFGQEIAFWGGVDGQRLLPFGKPEEVREEVRKLIDILGDGGGYLLSSCHNIQNDVPPENIIAMFTEAAGGAK